MVKTDSKVKTGSGMGSSDIAFLLIIFFMVSFTSAINTGLGVQLAKPDPDKNETLEQVEKDDVIAIGLLEDGRYFVNDSFANNLTVLEETLKREIAGVDEPKTSITVWDQRTYGQLLAVLDLARNLGLGTFSIRSNSTGYSWGMKVKKLLVEQQAEGGKG